MFKESYHRRLWALVKNSWRLVKMFGLTDTKIYLRKCYLKDDTEIPMSCYACDYAVKKQKKLGSLVQKCKYCPIDIGICNDSNSLYRRICEAVVSENKDEFEVLCDMMINAMIKPNVECEVDNNETNTNITTTV